MANKKTNNQEGKVVRFKLIFTENHRKDGTAFVVMKTILMDNGEEKWVEVKFGDEVNTKLFKGKNQVITAMAEDVSLPRSLKPYNKDGKLKYPYVWVEKIVDYTPYEFKGKTEPKETTQSAFQMDEEDTTPVTDGEDYSQYANN